jgi:1,4-alpha-glucan branching enzyme
MDTSAQRPAPGSLPVRTFTDYDAHLFAEGVHQRLYEKLGAHAATVEGLPGTRFAVWAPNAERVSVVGDFNRWQAGTHPLTGSDAGVWEGFIPGVHGGAIYKYAIESRVLGYRVDKADPFAFASEIRPQTASMVWDLSGYAWDDAAWLARRARANALDAPISIYEVHLGSWMRVPEEGNRWLTYRELAAKLPAYVRDAGFTHVELLPITEHPFDGSWGYQTVGYFAPTGRFGTPQDFMALVDALHRAGIGVILDWVPAHFPRDEHGLAYFDGTHLFEHADPRQGAHPDWGTLIFNYGRNEVANFLLASALFWLDRYHLDGLRIDAVASMLYLDYSREPGEWIPNAYGGRENLGAIAFLRRLNERVHAEHPDVVTIAEESTAWPMVTRPTYVGGLGFDYKWDMGWMHDTLDYFAHEPVHRRFHHDRLTFRMLYAWHEHFILPLSHDEVVHGKGSLLGKMPGDDWQKHANLRLLFASMFGQPGKKLLWMGDEIAQASEWDHDRSLEWHLLDDPRHAGIRRLVADLNRLYREEPALHERDTDPRGFEWVDCCDAEQGVVSFLRRGSDPDEALLFVCNYTPVPRHGYRIGVPWPGEWREILNSDAEIYGGSGHGNYGGARTAPVACHGHAQSLGLVAPPLAVIVLKSRRGVDGAAAPERGALGATQVRPVAGGLAGAAWQPTFGAVAGTDATRFRVWAPNARGVELRIEPRGGRPTRVALARVDDGMLEARVEDVGAGDRYAFFLDGAGPFPDPASRRQPEGVHGPSEVVDPGRFVWSDADWRGVRLEDLVLYELHVGTFTREGTFAAAADRLPLLRELGVTAIELMPVADFPGRRNWGYDPAALFAPARCYGTPDELRALVDAAHRLGLGVYLDVVYNHFGPTGAYATAFSRHFLTGRHRSPWGEGINLDGEHARQVREFFIENALAWIHEYHVDGLRVDATHALSDSSRRHFLAELAARVRAAAGERTVLLIAEDDRNLAALLLPETAGGTGIDAVWTDDFHHQMRRLLAGDSEGYLADFSGTVADLATTIRQGWLFTGQHSTHFEGPRGTDPSGIPSRRFVVCLQNHDQVGNRAMGDRLTDTIDLATYRAASALLLCVPETPLLFMGQEWAARTPFRYFTDHEPELGQSVTEGRRRGFQRFSAFAAPEARAGIPDPQALATFLSSRLNWDERGREPHAGVLRLYQALLAWRRGEPALRDARRDGFQVAALDDGTLALRREATDAGALLLVVRLVGAGACVVPPALAAGMRSILATTEEPRFAADPMPPRIDVGPPLRIEFARPSAVLLTSA